MADNGEQVCDQVFAINQAWKLKIAFELGILNDVERGRVLADFNEYFIKRKVKIE
jgi:hypothetical protein